MHDGPPVSEAGDAPVAQRDGPARTGLARRPQWMEAEKRSHSGLAL